VHNKCRKQLGVHSCCRCCAHLHALDLLLMAQSYNQTVSIGRNAQYQQHQAGPNMARTHTPRCVNLMATFSPVLLSNASCKNVRPLWFNVRMLVYLGLPARGSCPHWLSMLLCLLLGSEQLQVDVMNCSGC
jgi:hypothetical protein